MFNGHRTDTRHRRDISQCLALRDRGAYVRDRGRDQDVQWRGRGVKTELTSL